MPPENDRRPENLVPGAYVAPAGNQYGKKHGAYGLIDPEKIDAKIAEVAGSFIDATEIKHRGAIPLADIPMVRQAAETWCRLDQLREWIEEYGKLKTSKPRWTVIELELKLSARLQSQLEALGMTPAARVKLGLDVMRGQALSEGRRLDLTKLSDREHAQYLRLLQKATAQPDGPEGSS